MSQKSLARRPPAALPHTVNLSGTCERNLTFSKMAASGSDRHVMRLTSILAISLITFSTAACGTQTLDSAGANPGATTKPVAATKSPTPERVTGQKEKSPEAKTVTIEASRTTANYAAPATPEGAVQFFVTALRDYVRTAPTDRQDRANQLHGDVPSPDAASTPVDIAEATEPGWDDLVATAGEYRILAISGPTSSPQAVMLEAKLTPQVSGRSQTPVVIGGVVARSQSGEWVLESTRRAPSKKNYSSSPWGHLAEVEK